MGLLLLLLVSALQAGGELVVGGCDAKAGRSVGGGSEDESDEAEGTEVIECADVEMGEDVDCATALGRLWVAHETPCIVLRAAQ